MSGKSVFLIRKIFIEVSSLCRLQGLNQEIGSACSIRRLPVQEATPDNFAAFGQVSRIHERCFLCRYVTLYLHLA